jgi:hypothetical protein
MPILFDLQFLKIYATSRCTSLLSHQIYLTRYDSEPFSLTAIVQVSPILSAVLRANMIYRALFLYF